VVNDTELRSREDLVVLSFPQCFAKAEDKRIWSHTSPFCTRHEDNKVKPYPGSGSDVLPFRSAEGSRIHVLTIELILTRRTEPVYFFVTIKNAWLVSCIDEYGRANETTYVGWSDWGKKNSHWQHTERMHAWLRFIHGSRFIHPANPTTLNGSEYGHMVVSDFSKLPMRFENMAFITPLPGSYDDDEDGQLEDMEELCDLLDIPRPCPRVKVNSGKVFEDHEVETDRIPSRTLVSTNTIALSNYTGFMIDDLRILAFRTEGDGLTSFDALCFI